MKKIILAIVTILYMGVSSGVAMDIHYCMGRISRVDLYGKGNNKCDQCKTAEKMRCCGVQHKFYKLTNAHQNVFNSVSFAAIVSATVIPYPAYHWQYTSDTSYKAVANNSPPGYAGTSACIMNCNFRI